MTSTHRLRNALDGADLDAACRLAARSRSTPALQRELKDAVDADARPMRHGQLRPDTASRPTGRRPARTGGASLADDPGFSTRGSAALPFTMLVGA